MIITCKDFVDDLPLQERAENSVYYHKIVHLYDVFGNLWKTKMVC